MRITLFIFVVLFLMALLTYDVVTGLGYLAQGNAVGWVFVILACTSLTFGCAILHGLVKG